MPHHRVNTLRVINKHNCVLCLPGQSYCDEYYHNVKQREKANCQQQPQKHTKLFNMFWKLNGIMEYFMFWSVSLVSQ